MQTKNTLNMQNSPEANPLISTQDTHSFVLGFGRAPRGKVEMQLGRGDRFLALTNVQ